MPHRRRGRAVAAALAVGLALTVAGCSTDDAAEADPSPSSPASSSSPASPTDSPPPTESPTESAATGSPSASPTGVTTGGLADGFPTDVVPVLPDATITVSTVSSANGVRSVSLSGTSPTPADQVLAFYRSALVAQGFVETAAGQAVGAPTSTFTRGGGAELLVVAVTTAGAVQTFTVGGTIAG